MIGILDTKMGNISAIRNIYDDLEIEYISVSKADQINKISKLIIPGIGSFDGILNRLNENNLFDKINEFVIYEKKPVLGICIGMHIFYEYSDEGIKKGFGWIKNKIVKLNSKNMRYPHMGWNNINKLKDDFLFKEIENSSYFYFLHSYGNLLSKDLNFVTACSNYGDDIVSAIKFNNIYGVQFHPEKSHSNGIKLLFNFAKYCD
jgi:imidazole glycerol-phosphate synthase subunit HisH